MVRWTMCSVMVLLAGAGTWYMLQDGYSTPKGAVKSLYKAMVTGNTAEAQTAVADEMQSQIIVEMKSLLEAVLAAQEAAEKKFGALGKSVSGGLPSLEDIDAGTEKIDGDTATLTVKSSSKPLRFVRVGKRWKLDLFSVIPIKPADVAAAKRILSAAAGAANQVAKKIAAGVYRSAEDAEVALQGSMAGAAVMGEMFKGLRGG